MTSLIEAESIPKHIGLLEIKGKEFRVKPIPIPNVPFLICSDVDASFYLPSTLLRFLWTT